MSSEKISWGWNGSDYQKNSGSQEARALHALKACDLKPGMTVLDIGCGDGKITKRIAQVVSPGNVTGIDKDPSMLATAQKLCAEAENLVFIEADIRQFKGKKVDLITSFFCLQWIPEVDLRGVFKNIHDHLNEGGRICLLLAAYDFPHEIIKGMAFSNKWKSHFEGFQDQQLFLAEDVYSKILTQAGFDQCRVETIGSQHLLTPQEFVAFTRQWCGCYRYLKTEELREAFIQDILVRLNGEAQNADGKFTMVQKSIQLTAGIPSLALTQHKVLN